MTRPWPSARVRGAAHRLRRALKQLTTTLLDQETTSGRQVRAIARTAARARPPSAGARAASQQP